MGPTSALLQDGADAALDQGHDVAAQFGVRLAEHIAQLPLTAVVLTVDEVQQEG